MKAIKNLHCGKNKFSLPEAHILSHNYLNEPFCRNSWENIQ